MNTNKKMKKFVNIRVHSWIFPIWFRLNQVRGKLLLWGVILWGLLWLTACGQSDEPPAPAAAPAESTPIPFEGTIVAMGDSLTEGWGVKESESYPAQLARKLQADGYHFRVINAGVSGETSSGARSRVEWVLTLEPDIVILVTGGNDGLRAIDPALTAENLDILIMMFQAQEARVVLGGMETLENLGQEYTRAFIDLYPAAAEKHDLIFIPFFLEGVAGERDLNQPDGIHPTAEGYALIVENIYPTVLDAIATWREREAGRR